jgi:hypothetical protein
MKVGDLVRRTVPIPGIEKIYGIIMKGTFNSEACEVMWPDGSVTLPFRTNLEVVCEGR